MSFIFRKEFIFTQEVTIDVPGGGKEDFDACFKALDQPRLDALVAEGGDAALVGAVLVGWDRIIDEAKAPIPFSDAAREALIALPYARFGVAKAYWEAISGLMRGN